MALVGNVHLIRGWSDTVDNVLTVLEEEGVRVRGNPDVYVRVCDSFGIDEARELRERAALRPTGERRIFVVAASHMTSEAQNALLKTIEEPLADAMFFFIVPAPESLLPTLTSRSQILQVEGGFTGGADARQFLAAAPTKRLDCIKQLLVKDDRGGYNVRAIGTFLASLEREIARMGNGYRRISALHAVYRARSYMNDKGAFLKLLLEQVALLV